MPDTHSSTLRTERLPYSWEFEFSLVTDPFMLYEIVKVWAWTYALMSVLMSVMLAFGGGAGDIPKVLGIIGLVVLGLLLLSLLIMAVMFRRYRTRVTISADGVRQDTLSRVARTANRVAVIAGVLARRPGTAGAGLLAMSRESITCRWREVQRIKPHPRRRVITLMNGWRVVLRLYCTPDNYDTVLDLVTRGVAQRPSRPS